MTFKLIFLVRSNRAQNIPEMRQIKIDDDKIYSKFDCSLFFVFCSQKITNFSNISKTDRNKRYVNNYLEENEIESLKFLKFFLK